MGVKWRDQGREVRSDAGWWFVLLLVLAVGAGALAYLQLTDASWDDSDYTVITDTYTTEEMS